ncbi:MAG: putative metal-binding motif-containing protein, partial [bacterium]|nr:putative metal-binding motif-containing protein [bacterium]
MTKRAGTHHSRYHCSPWAGRLLLVGISALLFPDLAFAAVRTSGAIAEWPITESAGAMIKDAAASPANLDINDTSVITWLPAFGAIQINNGFPYIQNVPQTEADKIVNAIRSNSEAFTAELWISPSVADLNPPRDILRYGCSTFACTTISADGRFEGNFFIRQNGKNIQVGARNSLDGGTIPRVITTHLSDLIAGQIYHIVFRWDTNGGVIVVDVTPDGGSKLPFFNSYGGNFSNWGNSYIVTLGDGGAGGQGAWPGKIYSAAIYAWSLTNSQRDDNLNAGWQTCTDLDGDGYGNPASITCTKGDGGGVADCNDSNVAICPSAADCPDVCNGGTNDDCSAGTAEGSGEANWNQACDYADTTAPIDTDLDTCNDADIYGACSGTNAVCIDGDTDGDNDGYSDCSAICTTAQNCDCGDGNANVHPGATEICNNLDDDCNAATPIDVGCDDDNDNYCDSAMSKAGGVTVTTC